MKIQPDMLHGPDAEEIMSLVVIAKAELLVPNLFRPQLEIRRPDGAAVRVPSEMTIEGWREAFRRLLDIGPVVPGGIVITPVDITKDLKAYARPSRQQSGADTDKLVRHKIKEINDELGSHSLRFPPQELSGTHPAKVVGKLIGSTEAEAAKAMAAMVPGAAEN